MTILYTSGTTGDPKGVELSHRNVLFDCEGGLRMTGLEGTNLTVSYLPYAHIAERILTLYIPQHYGDVHVYLIADPTLLIGALGEVRPAQFFGVPRVWEKIQSGLSGLLAMEPDAAKKAAIQGAMQVGVEYVESLQVGHTTSPELQARFDAADAAVLGPIKAMLGLDQVIWAGSASAPMPLEVARFFAGLGMPIYDIWGMTETCGGATACGPGAFKLGTVGRPYPGIELRIADDGELLARGPIMTVGYHRRPEATADLIDAEGWLHTGDIASIDDDGFVSIVDRKKELIITSAGKNIAPSNIESLLKESPIVGHALAFGDNRPYVVAVLTLDGEVAPVVAQMAGIEFTRPRRPRGQAGDPGHGAGGRRPGQRPSLASRAGEVVRAAPGRVDGRVGGAHPHAQAQATRRARQVRRRDRPPLRLTRDRPAYHRAHRPLLT